MDGGGNPNDNTDEDDFDLLFLLYIEMLMFEKIPWHDSKLRGHKWVSELLYGHPSRCFEQLRMSVDCFEALCYHLVDKEYYKFEERQKISVEESVAIFLWLVATNPNHRNAGERFQHSPATISHHVRKVCDALQLLAAEIICPRNAGVTHQKIIGDRRFDPYFEKCCGEIDGTLIPGCIPEGEANAWRSRHGTPCQNVFAVCDFDMRFMFVNSGVEGSAHDTRVLADSASNAQNRFPMPITAGLESETVILAVGWFYLSDAGYTNTTGFLVPHKNSRYHLQDWVGARSTPRTPAELFNRCHSALRNVIERTFGVLKKRFHILSGLSSYSPAKQAKIVIACCALHNWIKQHDEDDELFQEFDEEKIVNDPDGDPDLPNVQFNTSMEHVNVMGVFRNQLTTQMWNNQLAYGPLFY